MKAKGDCYEAAGQYMMHECTFGNDDCALVLVHGEVMGQGPVEGIPFGHAWVEKDGIVIDRSNGRDLQIPAPFYYSIGQIDYLDNIIKYPWSEARKKILDYEHWGPWDLETSSGY